MLDLSKAFPERVTLMREAIAKHAANLRAADPIPLPEPDALSKIVQHDFKDGDRVVIHAPDHYHHGAHGTIISDANDANLRVRTDEGHELTAAHYDLIPESLAPTASNKIMKGLDLDPIPVDGDSGTGDTLAKRARSPFRVGQTVIEKGATKRTGEIVDVTPGGLVEIRFDANLSALCTAGMIEAA